MIITGKVEIDGVTVEIVLPHDNTSNAFTLIGPKGYDLDAVEGLMDNLHDALTDWANDNVCSECRDHLLDDGEGYDGKCGDCADRAETDDEEDDE